MAGKPRTFIDVIGLWPSTVAMADDLGVTYDVVRRWLERDSIPAWVWQDLLKHAAKRKIGLRADDLVKLAGR